MAIILGVKQNAKIYQLIQEKNNFTYINSSYSSNLLFLNAEDNMHDNATINFKNKYEFGYINNKISVYHTSNLITLDDISIDLFKDIYINCNLNVGDYFNTANNTTFFKNNVNINLNDNNENSFKIMYNTSKKLLELTNDMVIFNSSNIYTSNIYINPLSTLYTNFIDSPNKNPVVIRNMAFAESLRIFTTNIIQNLSIDNSIIFSNLDNYRPDLENPQVQVSDLYKWTNYLIDNNINIQDPKFTKPNINIIKFIGLDLHNNIMGGSNMLEFRTRQFGTYSSNLVYYINNNGYVNIGSNYNNYNSNVAFNIQLSPITSNIMQFTNINDNSKCYSINSNGCINIGSLGYYPNQVNIIKNNNNDRNNTELLSLNINNIKYSSNNNIIAIPFINNNYLTDFIFNFSSIYNSTLITIDITITNLFITNNIIKYSNKTLYEDYIINYAKITYDINNISNTETPVLFAINIETSLIYPKNVFNIIPIERIDNILSFIIYPLSLSTPPSILNTNLFNKIINTKIINNFTVKYQFYIYIYDYIYMYNGAYYPKSCDLINCKTNNTSVFSISEYGNMGIGNNYSDKYKLYITSNALINNLDCKIIDNYVNKNITFSECSLNNINILNTTSLIANTIDTINLNTQNIVTNNININSNVKINNTGNNNVIINVKTIMENINIGNNENNDYLLTLNTSNGISINNNIINNNPNILIKSSVINSYPYLRLQNTVNTYDIAINTLNNFELKLNTKSIIHNDNSKNNISVLDNSFVIYKDTSLNIKTFIGRCYSYDNEADWYTYMSDKGTNPTIKSSFNIFGDLNVYSTKDTNKLIMSSHIYNDIDVKIGFGTNFINNNIYYQNNGLLVNLKSVFLSNMTVNQNIYLGGTILSISDSNLKTNLNKIENSLSKIDLISGYTYTRKDTGNIETGLIAQEVLQILPEVIKYEHERYNISYGNMCGIFVECIKELHNKIKILDNKIAKLENIKNKN
jgi:hypothetical protein